ncbi:hypothetical protein ACIREE_05190 [Streptomyces sp. NPDC102467]|uniref:hypothetical protein n=1 Tax=Streptomyces sp. NPDC102467 TaxID=3366179 RepID=UPI0038000737
MTVAGLASVLVAVAVTVVVQGNGGSEGGHLAANRAQLKRACGGLLPYGDLTGRVPDAVAGRVEQYGTELEPGRESRSLVNCAVTWPGHGSVRVAAVPLIGRMPASVRSEDLVPGGRGPRHEIPGLTGSETDKDDPWVLAECPAGLRGQVRRTGVMYVTALVDLPRTGALTEFRTAVHLANGIAARQKCGGPPLREPTEVVDPYKEHVTEDHTITSVGEPGRNQPKCLAVGPRSGFPGKWTTSGDLQESRLLGMCAATSSAEDPKQWDVTAISAAGWAGPVGDSAYAQYRGEGESPDFQDGRRKTTIEDTDDAGLVLWARSQCAAGPTYHQVGVGFHAEAYGDSIELTRTRRARLSADVHKAMNAYLGDPEAWPRQQHCHGTRLLGEVEGWQ